MSRLNHMLTTLPRLGLVNIARVALYRASLKLPFSPIRRMVDRSEPVSDGQVFFKPEGQSSAYDVVLPKLFGYHEVGRVSTPPLWLRNPLNGHDFKQAERAFYNIPDFDPDVGDIKQIWELSRFGWLLDAASDRSAINQINSWLNNWLEINPPYQGPNWKCGQEASLRVLHILAAAHLLGALETPTVALQNIVALHLKRIAPTVSYAMAQDNNHGTSEAAALYIGGSWLDGLGNQHAAAWRITGRKLLENRAARLIGEDGSFSQYSTTYHRIMLDSYSFVEWWRVKLGDKAFSTRLQSKLKAAATWLYRVTDETSGDAPNLGANDGAHILNFAKVDYRDFRPSVAMAYALWHKQSVFEAADGAAKQLEALGVNPPSETAQSSNEKKKKNGGFSVLKQDSLMAVLHSPRFKFRPSQSDILHLDLWHKGRNILRDGGTYSYNSSAEDIAYFGGVKSHNTICFDGRDQMPRLGRFLFAAWPKLLQFSQSPQTVSAKYKDHAGAVHQRDVALKTDGLIVSDHISGEFSEAVLRWRFAPNLFKTTPKLTLDEGKVSFSSGGLNLVIDSLAAITARWETGKESRYYLHKNDLPVLVISAKSAGIITTTIGLKS